ncbi:MULTISPECIES: hypothetical protein [Saccharibacillus]|uniref:hypothetical protein n=1 Tax=Saccharibacillus TaxID=456492 RepID=UPI00123B30F8|nr:hypothetical protein [Saccharibacillus sp. WB 17]MWJ30317.1 hypothetical protein [Saccharibacillus sp. WB 17]
MDMNGLELKILGILRRHRWGAFRWLSMARLIRHSGGAFREVTIALVNLEQAAYIRWLDKSSMQHIVLLRKAYERPKTPPPRFGTSAADARKISRTPGHRAQRALHQPTGSTVKRRPTETEPPARRTQAAD